MTLDLTHYALISLGYCGFFVLFSLLFFCPKYGLFIVLIIRPILDNINVLRTTSIPGIGLNTLQVIGVIIPCCMVFVCLIKKMDIGSRKVSFSKYPFLNIYFLFMVSCLPFLVISINPVNAFGELLRLFTLWAIIVFTDYALETEDDIHLLLKVIILSSFYPLARLFIDLGLGNWILIGQRWRIIGGYFHMSVLSIMLLLYLPSYLYFLQQQIPKKHKLFLTFGVLAILMFTYLTYYRTALIGLISFLAAFSLFRKKYSWLITILLITCLTIIFVPALSAYFKPMLTLVFKIPYLFDPINTTYDFLLSGRFGIWRIMLTTFIYKSSLSNIIFGFGYYPDLHDNPAIRAIIGFSGHNDLLNLLFQFGVLSPILFITFLVSIVKLGFQCSSQLLPQIITSLLLALIVASMAHTTFLDVRNLLYIGVYVAALAKYTEIHRNFKENSCG